MLSVYMLTRNSQKYLAEILSLLSPVADDLLIVDSGSTDATKAIAQQFQARFLVRPFDNFKNQRDFALSQCQHDWVFSLDDDEIPDFALIESLDQLKRLGFKVEEASLFAYCVQRRWTVLGKNVRAFYPVTSPDYPVRLFNKTKVSFGAGSNRVHETPTGFSEQGVLMGFLDHKTCDTTEILHKKMHQYATLAAEDLHARKKNFLWFKQFSSPFFAFFKWYIRKSGWRDGKTGWLLGCYAFRYTFLKYRYAREQAAVETF